MTASSIVRRATPEDRGEIWRLFKLLADEQFMFTLSHRKIDYYIDRFTDPGSIEATDGGPRGIIAVIGEVGKLEGMLILGLNSYWYTDIINLDEFACFVEPQHRNSNHTKTLIAFATNLVDELLPDYPEIRLIMGILSVKRTAAKVRLYARKMQPVGGFFSYPPIPEVVEEPLREMYKNYNRGQYEQKPEKAHAKATA